MYFKNVNIFLFFCLFLGSLDANSTHSFSFLDNFLPKANMRYDSFLYSFQLMKERNVSVIVETGTARYGTCNCEGDGCSTVLFAEWAAQNKAKIYSVDINRQALFCAMKGVGSLKKYVHFIQSDSVLFLKNFCSKIDFLYLDSYDFELDNPVPSQEHHLKEIMAAYPWLTNESIVMIDDCDLPHGGKGKLVIEFLLNKGWKILYSGYQVILSQ